MEKVGMAVDPVRIVIETFESAFKDFELPASCIAIVDSNGLSLHTTGACPSLELFEGILGGIISAFERLRESLKASFNEVVSLITIELEEFSYYVDDIPNTDLYLVARTRKDLLFKAYPFLANVANTLHQLALAKDLQE